MYFPVVETVFQSEWSCSTGFIGTLSSSGDHLPHKEEVEQWAQRDQGIKPPGP